ncbi:TRAM domain-containing protein [Methyloraptor flagellatus]|uniref:TRAM domain-containing protein n=1 Tax=Methyloraptor flagellatus TaxID=3162530 RepID=A0AAU7X544_9HYPH
MQTTETVTVAAIGHKGDGVAETPTGRVFVPGSLPGETVTIARDGERGRIISIEAPSADRIAAACRHVGTCGGCSLQHMAPAAYLAFKRQSVIDAFADRGIEVSVAETVPVEAHSRRRAVIAVQRQEGRLVVGFRERLSHTVAPAEGCLVVTPAIAAAMPKLAELCDLLTFGKRARSAPCSTPRPDSIWPLPKPNCPTSAGRRRSSGRCGSASPGWRSAAS